MGATLSLLAAAPASVEASEQLNTIYCSLLEAHGYYLEHYHHDNWRRPDIRRQPITATGDLEKDLMACLADEPVDLVIVDWSFKKKCGPVLKKLTKGPVGLVILSAGQKLSHSKTDPFYQQLVQAEFHNLPAQFFTDLGKDTSGYNYLRKLFQLPGR
jgi:hypothetical protein